MRHIKRAALTEVRALAPTPKVADEFVTGQIDVSDLDLNGVVEKAGV